MNRSNLEQPEELAPSTQKDAAYDEGEGKEKEKKCWFSPPQACRFGSTYHFFFLRSEMQKQWGQLEIRFFTVCQERRLNDAKEIPPGVDVAGYF